MTSPQLQLDLSSPVTGKALKEIGMKKAEDTANSLHQDWSEKAYELLKQYVTINREPFLAEFFRTWTEGKLPAPPSLRAFGSIIRRAAKENLIERIGYAQVTNPKAHAATGGVWRKK